MFVEHHSSDDVAAVLEPSLESEAEEREESMHEEASVRRDNEELRAKVENLEGKLDEACVKIAALESVVVELLALK